MLYNNKNLNLSTVQCLHLLHKSHDLIELLSLAFGFQKQITFRPRNEMCVVLFSELYVVHIVL